MYPHTFVKGINKRNEKTSIIYTHKTEQTRHHQKYKYRKENNMFVNITDNILNHDDVNNSSYIYDVVPIPIISYVIIAKF